MYREFEVKKLLADQKQEFEERLRKELLEKEKELEREALRKASKGATFQTPNPFPDDVPQFLSTPNQKLPMPTNKGPETH